MERVIYIYIDASSNNPIKKLYLATLDILHDIYDLQGCQKRSRQLVKFSSNSAVTGFLAVLYRQYFLFPKEEYI